MSVSLITCPFIGSLAQWAFWLEYALNQVVCKVSTEWSGLALTSEEGTCRPAATRPVRTQRRSRWQSAGVLKGVPGRLPGGSSVCAGVWLEQQCSSNYNVHRSCIRILSTPRFGSMSQEWGLCILISSQVPHTMLILRVTRASMAFLVSAALQSTAHSRCMSAPLSFPWTLVPWLPWWDIADAAANPCSLKSRGRKQPTGHSLALCVLHVGCSQAVPHIGSGPIKKTGTLHRIPTCHAVKRFSWSNQNCLVPGNKKETHVWKAI